MQLWPCCAWHWGAAGTRCWGYSRYQVLCLALGCCRCCAWPWGAAAGTTAVCPRQDLHDGRIQMKTLTNKWYEEVRQGPSGSEDDEQELLQQSGAGAR